MFHVTNFIINVTFCSAVVFVRTVAQGHQELVHHRDGMLIIPFVIHVINKETRVSRVPFAIELIVLPPIEKWLNVACAISKTFL